MTAVQTMTLLATLAATAIEYVADGWIGVAVCCSGFLVGYAATRAP